MVLEQGPIEKRPTEQSCQSPKTIYGLSGNHYSLQGLFSRRNISSFIASSTNSWTDWLTLCCFLKCISQWTRFFHFLCDQWRGAPHRHTATLRTSTSLWPGATVLLLVSPEQHLQIIPTDREAQNKFHFVLPTHRCHHSRWSHQS